MKSDGGNAWKIGDAVFISVFKITGVIRSIWIKDTGPTYQVQWVVDGCLRDEYFSTEMMSTPDPPMMGFTPPWSLEE